MNQTPILLLIGNNVRNARVNAGLTQEELGLLVNLDRTYVSGIERGIRNPTAVVLERLAKGLEVSVVSLVAPAQDKKLKV